MNENKQEILKYKKNSMNEKEVIAKKDKEKGKKEETKEDEIR